jgi:N-acetylmuramoyl-L-alanine amidase
LTPVAMLLVAVAAFGVTYWVVSSVTGGNRNGSRATPVSSGSGVATGTAGVGATADAGASVDATPSVGATDAGNTTGNSSSNTGAAATATTGDSAGTDVAGTAPTNGLPLSGKVIVIDPGHQKTANTSTEPIGPGASEKKAKVAGGTRGVATGIPESKTVLEIGLQLRDALQAQGATVYMTRTKQNVDVWNSRRAQLANDKHADLFLRLHCDGAAGSKTHGISTLVPAKNTWTAPIVKSSAAAGKAIQAALIAATGAADRGVVKRSDLSGFNYCEVTSVLVELGFMTNAAEDRKLNSADYQQKLVAGLTQGCIDYLEH